MVPIQTAKCKMEKLNPNSSNIETKQKIHHHHHHHHRKDSKKLSEKGDAAKNVLKPLALTASHSPAKTKQPTVVSAGPQLCLPHSPGVQPVNPDPLDVRPVKSQHNSGVHVENVPLGSDHGSKNSKIKPGTDSKYTSTCSVVEKTQNNDKNLSDIVQVQVNTSKKSQVNSQKKSLKDSTTGKSASVAKSAVSGSQANAIDVSKLSKSGTMPESGTLAATSLQKHRTQSVSSKSHRSSGDQRSRSDHHSSVHGKSSSASPSGHKCSATGSTITTSGKDSRNNSHRTSTKSHNSSSSKGSRHSNDSKQHRSSSNKSHRHGNGSHRRNESKSTPSVELAANSLRSDTTAKPGSHTSSKTTSRSEGSTVGTPVVKSSSNLESGSSMMNTMPVSDIKQPQSASAPQAASTGPEPCHSEHSYNKDPRSEPHSRGEAHSSRHSTPGSNHSKDSQSSLSHHHHKHKHHKHHKERSRERGDREHHHHSSSRSKHRSGSHSKSTDSKEISKSSSSKHHSSSDRSKALPSPPLVMRIKTDPKEGTSKIVVTTEGEKSSKNRHNSVNNKHKPPASAASSSNSNKTKSSQCNKDSSTSKLLLNGTSSIGSLKTVVTLTPSKDKSIIKTDRSHSSGVQKSQKVNNNTTAATNNSIKSKSVNNTVTQKISSKTVKLNLDAASKKRKLNFDEQISPGLLSNAKKQKTIVTPKKKTTRRAKNKKALAESTPKKGQICIDKIDVPQIDDDQCLYPKRNVYCDPSGVSMPRELDYRLRNCNTHRPSNLKFDRYIHVEIHPNGGAPVVHAYQDEISVLSSEDRKEFVEEFLKFVFSENERGRANHVMGIVHGAATRLPDLVEYLAIKHPNLQIKKGTLGKSDIETMYISEFRNSMHSTYSAGTFRSGGLNEISIVGVKAEEVGDYFPELLDMLESDPFLHATMPWGPLSMLHGLERKFSNDGPIIWTRPGEQVLPTADMPKSPFKRKR